MKSRKPYDVLLSSFQAGKCFNYKGIAKEFQVSIRQAQRWIKAIQVAGYQIETVVRGKEKVFYLQASGLVEEVSISLVEEQWYALLVASEATRALLGGTPFEKPLLDAFNGIIEQGEIRLIGEFDLSEERKHWYFKPLDQLEINLDFFRTIVEALWKQEPLLIDYFTASTMKETKDRKIDPYCLAFIDGNWILVAFCHLRKSVLKFSLMGIKSLCLVEESLPFDTDDFSPDNYFSQQPSALGGSEEAFEVILRIDASLVPYFEAKQYYPKQEIKQINSDGSALVSFEADSLQHSRSFVQSFGSKVKVINPTSLVSLMKEELEKLNSMY